MTSIAVVILTFNESLHLERCIRSLLPVCSEVFVVDSFSSDNTKEISESLGAKFYQHPWKNYAEQFNWGLDNLPIQSEWVMRMDADEFLLPELISELKSKMDKLEEDITGLIIKRRVYFMDKWIKHGGYYPIYLLRIWKYGKGKCENRWMDEHIKISEGRTLILDNDLVDDNLNNLSWWTQKHNNYATREAVDLLNIKYKFFKSENNSELGGKQDKRKRWIKEKVYTNVPLFIRPIFYFGYRYFIRLGFLDGIPGIMWHFLQGFWYRFLVDAKVYQIEQLAKKENKTIPEVIKENYHIDIN